MELADPVARGVAQLGPQELGEKMVVAVPGGLGVEALDEDIVGNKPLCEVRAVVTPGHRIREIRREALCNGCCEQEVARIFGLPLEHLREQIIGSGTLVQLDRLEDGYVLAARSMRKREEADPGGPALGLLEQEGQHVRLELDTEPVEQLARLVGGQREMVRAELRQLTARPKQVERERWVVTRREHQAQARRRSAQQLLDRGADVRAADAVEVIDDQHERLFQLGEAVQQLYDERRGRTAAGRGKSPQRGPRRRHVVHCRQPLGPKTCFRELRARRQPRDLARLRSEPRRKQRRLAGTRGSGDERQRALDAFLQQLEESRAVDKRAGWARDRKIRSRDGSGSWTTGLGGQGILLIG